MGSARTGRAGMHQLTAVISSLRCSFPKTLLVFDHRGGWTNTTSARQIKPITQFLKMELGNLPYFIRCNLPHQPEF